ncbi:MAG: MCP four helix bundle domain-containing protein [Candidatus Gastranaerophilales bacterium]|nr:MCP four helix bundle domain-containing protein [Candidatus Gastranaerophilales bacterium]
MQWFKDLKTAQKILILIMLMVVYIVVIGLISYNNARTTTMMMRNLYYNHLMPVKWLNDIRAHNRANEANLFWIVTSDNLAEKQGYLADIELRVNKVDKDLANFKKISLDSYEQKNLKLFEENLKKYRANRSVIVQMALNGKSDEAYKSLKANRSLIDNTNRYLRALSVYSEKKAHDIEKQNEKNAARMQIKILIIIILALISLIPSGLFIAGLIAVPLSELAAKMKEFTEGDLSVKPLKIQSKDEIGELNTAFNIMTQNIRDLVNKEQFLRTINNRILTAKTLEEAIQNIVAEIGKSFNADRVVFRFFDMSKELFSGVIGEYRKNQNISSVLEKGSYSDKEVDNYINWKIFKEKTPLIMNNINDPEYPEPFRKFCLDINVKSAIIMPVVYKNINLAAIYISCTENFRTWEKEKIDFLIPVFEQIAIGINLFILNDKLIKSLNNEINLREIIVNVRKLEDHDDIYNYLLDQLADIFNVKRCLHLHFDKDRNLYVQNEIIKDKNLESLLGQTILCTAGTMELIPDTTTQIIAVNDVAKEIRNIDLKTYLLNKNIRAVLLYPTFQTHIIHEPSSTDFEEEILGTTLITSSKERMWTQEEINLFKLIIDTVSIIYLETLQRQKTDEIRKTFIATLTHDLRSPIFAEQKALEFILSKDLESSLKEFYEYLENIYETNEELLRLVNNLLMTYHLESGKFELNRELSNFSDIINSSVRSLRLLAQDQESEITTNIEENLPLVMIDKVEINRVLTNLISNAIKHNKKGTKINIIAKKIDNEILVSISDNGKGIPESERKNIFQRYPTAKRKIGTGLGLYISKQIIEAHNGKIWFETEKEKGTAFLFTLPIS